MFHEALPDAAIDRVFAVMALCPQHIFQVLTKRPARMREYVAHPEANDRIYQTAWERRPGGVGARVEKPDHPFDWRWPLPNVWLGVSAENQPTADERIPLLLDTPAALRFVSYEPALGPVDYRKWLVPEMHVHATAKLPMPAIAAIGRAAAQHIGAQPFLEWIIMGGESGPGARPFDMTWARSIIAQCKAAGVTVFIKQLGAYVVDRNRHHGASVRVHLRDRKGGNVAEWPENLRVRGFPGA